MKKLHEERIKNLLNSLSNDEQFIHLIHSRGIICSPFEMETVVIKLYFSIFMPYRPICNYNSEGRADVPLIDYLYLRGWCTDSKGLLYIYITDDFHQMWCFKVNYEIK